MGLKVGDGVCLLSGNRFEALLVVIACHLLGYVGEVDDRLMAKEPGKFQLGEIIGKAGFEFNDWGHANQALDALVQQLGVDGNDEKMRDSPDKTACQLALRSSAHMASHSHRW